MQKMVPNRLVSDHYIFMT